MQSYSVLLNAILRDSCTALFWLENCIRLYHHENSHMPTTYEIILLPMSNRDMHNGYELWSHTYCVTHTNFQICQVFGFFVQTCIHLNSHSMYLQTPRIWHLEYLITCNKMMIIMVWIAIQVVIYDKCLVLILPTIYQNGKK